MESTRLNKLISVNKKMNAAKNEENLRYLSELVREPILTEFLKKSEIFLNICRDDSLGEFIKSDYNSEGDSFRSPWSNKYFPDLEVPKYPPSELRELEVLFNKIFKEYSRLYYGESSVSSVYVWEQDESIENGFSVSLLISNSDKENKWDSSNIVTVKFSKEKEKTGERLKVTYKLNCSVIYKICNCSEFCFSGSLSKVVEETHYINSFLNSETHIEKIGKLVENTENAIRITIDEIYVGKTKAILDNFMKIEQSNNGRIDKHTISYSQSNNLFNLFSNR